MKQGHEVTAIDNFFTGSKFNVEQWIGHKNFEIIRHDIVNPLYIESKIKKILPDKISLLYFSYFLSYYLRFHHLIRIICRIPIIPPDLFGAWLHFRPNFWHPLPRLPVLLILRVCFSVDYIYHLASPASPPHYMQNPVKTIKTNTLGTINMLGKLL